MFESAELGHKIAKDVYKLAVPELREALLEAQYDLREAGRFPSCRVSNVSASGAACRSRTRCRAGTVTASRCEA